MPKPKKPRRRKDTLLYMSALQMIGGNARTRHDQGGAGRDVERAEPCPTLRGC